MPTPSRSYPNGWWIFPSFLLGSALWIFLICIVVKALFFPDQVEMNDHAVQLHAPTTDTHQTMSFYHL